MNKKKAHEVYEEFEKKHPEPNIDSEEFKALSHEEQTKKIKEWQRIRKEYIQSNYPDVNIYEQVRLHPKKVEAYDDLALRQRQKSTEKTVELINELFEIITVAGVSNNEMYIYNKGVYTPQAQNIIKTVCRIIYRKTYTTTLANEVIAKIEADTMMLAKDFYDAEPTNKICVANGIVNLETKELEPHTPKEYHFTKLPVTYDDSKECPHIIQFFKEVLKHESDVKVMQQIFGWTLLKKYVPEKGVMFIGTGRNGKGKTLQLLNEFLGYENVTSVPLQQIEERPFMIASLHKKLANIAGDLDSKALQCTGRFKELTGGDLVTADRKHQEPIKFRNYAKMIFASNQLPTTYDNTHAFFARWILFEFPYTFVKESEYDEENESQKLADPNVIDSLTTSDEMSGLLNWAIEGLSTLRDNADFSHSKNTEEVRKMWIRKSDSFASFCMDFVEENWDGYVEKSELSRVYSLYCRKNKIDMVSDQQIKRYLAEHFGATTERITLENDRPRVWKGIELAVQGGQEVHPFYPKGKNKNLDIGVKPMDFVSSVDRHTTSSVENKRDTLNIDMVKLDITSLPVDNESFLRSKYGDKRIDSWVMTGELFQSRPGTLKVMK